MLDKTFLSYRLSFCFGPLDLSFFLPLFLVGILLVQENCLSDLIIRVSQ